MRPRNAAVLLALLLLVTACGSAEASGPPEINYGRDICVECNMIISEVGHAAAYRLDDGTEKKFDGIGEMVKHGREHEEFASADAWVHDYTTEEWVEAPAAFYVPTLAISSPMGHGIFAFADRESADEFATGVDGEVIEWSTVLLLPVTDGLVGDHHDHEMDEMDNGDEMDHDHEGTMDMEESE